MATVEFLHKRHPDWCEKEIAVYLNKSWGAVRSAARRLQKAGRIDVMPPALRRYETNPSLRFVRPRD